MPHNHSNSDSHLTTFKSSNLISTERDIPQLRKRFLIKKKYRYYQEQVEAVPQRSGYNPLNPI